MWDLPKRNAFHGGEKLTVNLHGSHEWQTISQAGGGSTRINSYEYGSDVSVESPRIITPWNMFRTMEQNERRGAEALKPLSSLNLSNT